MDTGMSVMERAAAIPKEGASHVPDGELLRRFVEAQDRLALGELFARLADPAYRLARRMLRNDADAQDAVQAALVLIVRQADRYCTESGASVRAWSMGFVLHVCKNHKRAAARRAAREKNAAMEPFVIAEPASGAERGELHAALFAALERLPEYYRAPLWLHYFERMTSPEVAVALGQNESTVRSQLARGLDRLRQALTASGFSASVLTLPALLASLPVEPTPTALVLTAKSIAASGTVGVTFLGGGAGAASSGALAAKAGVALLGVAAIATAVALSLTRREVPPATRVAVAAAVTDEEAPTEDHSPVAKPVITVTPRGDDAWMAFEMLAGQGGPRVLLLGESRELLVPAELRFQPVEGRKLVEAVAAAYALKTAWVRERQYAILFAGVSDQEVARVKADLASADAVVRRAAAWRSRWLRDVRVVPLLVKAAKDKDAEAARQAQVGLRQIGWAVVLALDEAGWDLLDADLLSHDISVRRSATLSLGRVGGEKALARLEKALADQDNAVRLQAVSALGHVGGEMALVLLKKALADQNAQVRWQATSALGVVGGEKALVLLEKALADQNPTVREQAISALGGVGGEKALALLEKTLADQDANARRFAVSALGRLGGEKALALLEKALADQDANVRRFAVSALGHVGGGKALALLKKALAHQDDGVRCQAAIALGHMGGEKALALLENALAGQDLGVRMEGVSALGSVGGEGALVLIEKALTDQEAVVRRGAVCALGHVGGEKALALLEKALADQDNAVRLQAASALGRVGGGKALTLFEKLLANRNAGMRREAVSALGRVGGEKARDLLLNCLANEKDGGMWRCVADTLRSVFAGDPAVDQAIKDFKPPEAHPPHPAKPPDDF